MTFAVQGRTLPTNVSNYPAVIEGVEGFVLSLNGHVAFLATAKAEAFARSMLPESDRDTQPVSLPYPTQM